MDVLVDDKIINKLDSYGGKCPKLIYDDIYVELHKSVSLFGIDAQKFAAVAKISIEQQFEPDDDDQDVEYIMHIYVYHKDSNKPIIRADLRFRRLIAFEHIIVTDMKVNFKSTDTWIGTSDEDISIHNVVAVMFENAVDDIKSSDIDNFKYYLKNLRGALEIALITMVKDQ